MKTCGFGGAPAQTAHNCGGHAGRRSAAGGHAQATCRSAAYVTHAPGTERGGVTEAGSTGTMEAAVTRLCAPWHRSHVHKHLMEGAQATLGLAVELNIRFDDANLRQTLRTYSISLQAPESPPGRGHLCRGHGLSASVSVNPTSRGSAPQAWFTGISKHPVACS